LLHFAQVELGRCRRGRIGGLSPGRRGQASEKSHGHIQSADHKEGATGSQRPRAVSTFWNDPEMREVCDIEAEQKPYHPSQLTRFRNRIGIERLERIMNSQMSPVDVKAASFARCTRRSQWIEKDMFACV